MDLDPQIAETIVSNLKDIIQHEINLFDTTGTIIASTDRSRIGTSHDGARLAISTQSTVSIDSEHEFKGAKHGINVPVLFNGVIVGAVVHFCYAPAIALPLCMLSVAAGEAVACLIVGPILISVLRRMPASVLN